MIIFAERSFVFHNKTKHTLLVSYYPKDRAFKQQNIGAAEIAPYWARTISSEEDRMFFGKKGDLVLEIWENGPIYREDSIFKDMPKKSYKKANKLFFEGAKKTFRMFIAHMLWKTEEPYRFSKKKETIFFEVTETEGGSFFVKELEGEEMEKEIKRIEKVKLELEKKVKASDSVKEERKVELIESKEAKGNFSGKHFNIQNKTNHTLLVHYFPKVRGLFKLKALGSLEVAPNQVRSFFEEDERISLGKKGRVVFQLPESEDLKVTDHLFIGMPLGGFKRAKRRLLGGEDKTYRMFFSDILWELEMPYEFSDDKEEFSFELTEEGENSFSLKELEKSKKEASE